MVSLRENLIPSSAIAIFGSGGLVTGLINNGLFFEACKAAGLLSQFPFAIEATLSTCLKVGAPFVVVLGVSLFSTVLASLMFETHRWLSDYFFPTLSFFEVFTVWVAKDYVISGAFGWAGFVHMSAIGAICAFSQGIHLGNRRLQKSVKSMLKTPATRMKDIDVKMKRLEIEHNSIQATLQWIVWTVIIFLTAGVGGYYYSSFGGDPNQPLIQIRLLNLFNGMTWALIGFLFGMFMPLAKIMEWLTSEMAELAKKS